MNYREIKSKLEELKITPRILVEGPNRYDKEFFNKHGENASFNNILNENFGPLTEVYQHGGEGEGNTYVSVWYFENHDVYISVDGYYDSYEGTDFSDSEFTPVRPKEVMKIEYQYSQEEDQ